MFTKFVVSVASVSSTRARPRPGRPPSSIAPGSLGAGGARGDRSRAASSTRSSAPARGTRRSRCRAPTACSANSRRTSGSTTPDSRSRRRGRATSSSAPAARPVRGRRAQARDRSARPRRSASAAPRCGRRARPREDRARRPPWRATPSPTAHAFAICGGPIHAAATRAHADAAITLLSAIHAKFVTYSTTATSAGAGDPERRPCRDDRRHAQPRPERRQRRDQRRAGHAADADQGHRRAPDRTTPARLAPTWNVVATMLAPTKIRNRSMQRLRLFGRSETGRMSAAFTRGQNTRRVEYPSTLSYEHGAGRTGRPRAHHCRHHAWALSDRAAGCLGPGASARRIPWLRRRRGGAARTHARGFRGADRWRLVSIQGLHRFYQRRADEVVASWMTRQDRELAIADNLAYVAAVIDAGRRRASGRPAARLHRIFAGRGDGFPRRRGVGAPHRRASSRSAATCRPNSTRARSPACRARSSAAARATSGIQKRSRTRRSAPARRERPRHAGGVRRRP